MKQNEIITISGTDYVRMTIRLLRTADLAEKIRQKTQGKEAPLIGIKPNLVTPSPAQFGATTHPEIVEGILLYLKEQGFHNLLILEGSWVGDQTAQAFEYCGYQRLSEQYEVPLFDTQKDTSFPVRCSDSMKDLTLHLCSCVSRIDFLINVPVLKGHCQTRMTCALKNMKGLIPNSEKRRFHSLGLHRPIAALNSCIRQDFIVVDHICGDPDFEEGGNPLIRNRIFVSEDPVLTDAYACRELEIVPTEVEYLMLSQSLGIGSCDLNEALITALSDPAEEDKSQTPLPALMHKSLRLNYATEELESCSACYSCLTQALNRLDEEGLLRILTDKMHCRFCIGQGYRGQSCKDQAFIGIGNCTRSFQKNIPGCPPSEDDIYNFLKSFISASC
ncbi:MAG: DUF362 domain-containing protein [Parasporobacterium sp.]|nr:DUF362 domain-containing protein [Parasporobacterium sp.]